MIESRPSSGAASPQGARAATNPVDLDLENFTPGALWRGRFQMGDQLPDITHGKVLRAREVALERDVTVRSFRVVDGARERTWTHLLGVRPDILVPLVEAIEHEGRRFEVSTIPRGSSLTQWTEGGRKVAGAEFLKLVEALFRAVSEFHSAGIAHLNLTPNTIFIDGAEDFRVTLGGVESATEYAAGGLISVSVDPFYAPPECVGLYQHACAPSLRAWDWWSVGRILQQMLLGQHVLGVLLGRDVSRHTPELLIRAENLLREKDAASSKAGGVELMPAMEPRVMTLLRGLLSSCRDARWGRYEVEQWIRGGNLGDKYDLGLHDRLFPWKDRFYTVEEAAAHFAQAEAWDDGVHNLFGADDKTTLVHFLAGDSGHRRLADKVRDLTAGVESTSFAAKERAVVKDAIASVAFAILARGTQPLRYRGRTVDRAFVSECLAPEAQPRGLALVEALTERVLLQQLVTLDDSRWLGDFEQLASTALRIAMGERWISGTDVKGHAALWLQCLASGDEARRRLEAGKQRYAVSRIETLCRLFGQPTLSRPELAVLNFTLSQPEHYRYVTHETWTAEQHDALLKNGERVALAMTWLSLARTLRVATHLLGPWPVFLAYWSILAACIALAVPSRATLSLGLVVWALGWGLRLLLKRWARSQLVRRVGRESAGARLSNGSRCDEEAARLLGGDAKHPTLRDLRVQLQETRSAIAQLRLQRPSPGIAEPQSFTALKSIALAAGLVTLGLLGVLGFRVFQHPPTWPVLEIAWFHPETGKRLQPGDANPAATTPGSKEMASASQAPGASRDASDALDQISWPFRKPETAARPRLISTDPASREQIRAAEAAGAYGCREYVPDTIDGWVAVKVPTATGAGFMLYDGRTGEVARTDVFVMSHVPLARTWLHFGESLAIYLGER